MPKKLAGKKLSAREHRQFKHVMASETDRGLPKDRAAAAATSVVKKGRATVNSNVSSKRKRGKKGKLSKM